MGGLKSEQLFLQLRLSISKVIAGIGTGHGSGKTSEQIAPVLSLLLIEAQRLCSQSLLFEGDGGQWCWPPALS